MSRPVIKSEDGLFMLLEGIIRDCHKDIAKNNSSARDAQEVLNNLAVILRG